MSILPVDTINAITETIGLKLKDGVAQALLADGEYRMREVIYDARKFMRHRRATKLQPEDINSALQARNVQPLYGFTNAAAAKFKSTVHGATRIFYLEDTEIDLDVAINAPLPPVPLDVAFTAHWLAIDGVQPAIVQNPTPADIRSAAAESTQQAISRSIAQQSAASGTPAPLLVSSSNPDTATVNGETLVKSVLSKELQMYHDKITESVLSQSAEVQALAIQSLENDPGIQPLLPYFVQFMTQKITKHIRNLKILWAMMRMTRALLNNKNLFIEPYLHQLMPNIITCIVSKRISESPLDDHHALRRFSAELASYICHTYTSTYPTLQPRVTKTLLRAFLDPLKPNATHYGAITGLSLLGNEVIKLLIRPNVRAFVTECLSADHMNSVVEADRKDAKMVEDLLVDVLAGHVGVEYVETERVARERDPAAVRRPTVGELEKEFGEAFGEVVGRRVARVLDAELEKRGEGGGVSLGVAAGSGVGDHAARDEMDLDLDL
ncbi:hypothetical protein HDU98_000506 [Podochytrium sp. JEL0797]|nr:hypothetical protein HDU98_000506 [Podochytrium sp. JEL0797]